MSALTTDDQETLKAEDDIFKKIIDGMMPYCALSPDEKAKAESIFKQKFPTLNLQTEMLNIAVQKYTAECRKVDQFQTEDVNINAPQLEVESSRICPNSVFDPVRRNYLKASVIPPTNQRNKKKEFDVYRFILRKQENGSGYPLTWNDDPEQYTEDLILDGSDRHNTQLVADQQLRKIAKLLTTLNTSCNFKMLELKNEKRIH